MTIASRLDSFSIPKSSYHLIISCDIFPCTYSDHDFVILNLDFRDRINRGPGVWKFNNSLLNDVLFRTEIKSLSISYSRRKSRIRCRGKALLTNQLILLKRQLASGFSSILNSDDVEVYSLEELLTVHEQFYTLLYSEEPIDSEIQNFLFSQVTSGLSQPESDSCESPLSL